MPRHALVAVVLLLFVFAPAGVLQAGEEEEPRRPGVPDAELQKQINEAIERGADWLRSKQTLNGAIGGVHTRAGQAHYEIGATALAGLALLAAGDKQGDSSVDRVLGYLKGRDELRAGGGSRTTYDTGTLLMFVTAYYRPKDGPRHGRGGSRTGHGQGNPCALPEDVLKWVQDMTSWLVRVRKRETSTWGYPADRDDHSNTQYAYLGLRAARDCGARVPSTVFIQGLETMMERQQKEGPKVPRVIPSPTEGGRSYVVGADHARGWSYMQEPFLATGSMTTAALAILAICHDALTRPSRISGYTEQHERDVQTSVQDGFAWLDHFFSVERNPPMGAPPWHHYYLYGLERAGVLGGRDLLGEHDWYIEGARHLVSKQAENGKWVTGSLGGTDYEANGVLDTAWAVLFLARATRPLPPIKAPVVTEND